MKIPYDKKLHFLCGLSAGVTAGVAKEVYDYYDYALFDKYDMFYTWAGALIGTCLCLVVQI